MEDAPAAKFLEDADVVSLKAGGVFTPRTPVSTSELFAGRWGQIKTWSTPSPKWASHAVAYGSGVGKTSPCECDPHNLKGFDKNLLTHNHRPV
jgi:hypothetical protein